MSQPKCDHNTFFFDEPVHHCSGSLTGEDRTAIAPWFVGKAGNHAALAYHNIPRHDPLESITQERLAL